MPVLLSAFFSSGSFLTSVFMKFQWVPDVHKVFNVMGHCHRTQKDAGLTCQHHYVLSRFEYVAFSHFVHFHAKFFCFFKVKLYTILNSQNNCCDVFLWFLVTGFPRSRDFGKKAGIVICDSRPGNSREFHLFCLEFGKMRASEFFLKLKWWVMYFWQSRDTSLAYLQARM